MANQSQATGTIPCPVCGQYHTGPSAPCPYLFTGGPNQVRTFTSLGTPGWADPPKTDPEFWSPLPESDRWINQIGLPTDLKDMKPNWDGYGAQPIGIEPLRTAASMALVPGGDGSLQFELHNDDREVNVNIGADGRPNYVYVRGMQLDFDATVILIGEQPKQEEKRIVLDIAEAVKLLQASPELGEALCKLVAPMYEQEIERLTSRVVALEIALEPFADYADKNRTIPKDFQITQGSNLARRQLTMGDCYAVVDALAGAA